ncbi:MAG: hypothetical protein KDE54_11795, partial [Caldilineaceae bacterium]|nr:hypothetical protein [Caldilineaceae bacterium]
ADGNVIESETARVQASNIASFLQSQIDSLKNLLPKDVVVWGPEIIPYAVSTGDEEQIATDLNANILIYGNLHELANSRFRLEPMFHINLGDDQAYKQATELGGDYALGTPIRFRQSFADEGEVNVSLRIRVQALAQMLLGLSYMQGGTLEDYQDATELFQRVANESEWANLNDGTGQEILYHFLGAGYLSQAYLTEDDAEERFALLTESKTHYERAIQLNKEYVRSLNGLGAVNFQLARRLSDNEDGCSMDWDLLEEVRLLREAALNSPFEAKPSSGNVDLQALFGLGRVDFLVGDCAEDWPFSAAWEKARENYQAAITEFEKIDEPQSSAYSVAGYVHSDLGYIAFNQMWTTAVNEGDRTPKVDRLLALATEQLAEADRLLALADTEESLNQNKMIMASFLSVLCLDGHDVQAADELNELLERIEQSGLNFAPIRTIRDEIISEMNSISFVPWEACQGETQ